MIVLGALDPDRYRRIVLDHEPVAIDPAALARVEAARARLLAHLEQGGRAYGVNTGVGALAGTALEPDAQLAFQRALLARGAGTGPPLAPEVVRGALLLRLAGFLDGAAGVSPALCAFLADRLNDGWSPLVPSQGISSAGEVVALSHLFGTLAGEGEVLEDGVPVPAADALARRGVAPFEPGVKEGIALVNGAPLAPALTASLVSRARGVLDHATLAGALAVAASGGSLRPHSTRIAALKGDPGQAEVAAALVAWHAGAEDWSDRPQPPVSTRVLPQVLGAALDLVDHAARRSSASCTRSPTARRCSTRSTTSPPGLYPSGNFHAQALAFALDTLKLAFAQVANVAEKGLHRLLDHRYSGLPDQLAAEPGTETGPRLPPQGGDRARGRLPAARDARERPERGRLVGAGGRPGVHVRRRRAARRDPRPLRADRRRLADRGRAGAGAARPPAAAAAGGGGDRDRAGAGPGGALAERRSRAGRGTDPHGRAARVALPCMRTCVRMIVCVLIPRFALAVAAGGRDVLAAGPVALAPEPGREQFIGEVSAAAEAYGVRAGLRLGEALARCPTLRLVAPDPAGVADAWEAHVRALEGIGAAVEPGAPGTAWFAAGGIRALHGGTLEGVLAAARRALRGAHRTAPGAPSGSAPRRPASPPSPPPAGRAPAGRRSRRSPTPRSPPTWPRCPSRCCSPGPRWRCCPTRSSASGSGRSARWPGCPARRSPTASDRPGRSRATSPRARTRRSSRACPRRGWRSGWSCRSPPPARSSSAVSSC